MMKRVMFFGLIAAMGCTGTLPPLDPAHPSDPSTAPPASSGGGSYGHPTTPATHQPCNAQNACALIIAEIKRGCGLLERADAPTYCEAYLRR